MKKAVFVYAAVWLIGCMVMLAIFDNAASPAPDIAAVNDALKSQSIDMDELLNTEYKRMEAERRQRDTTLKILLLSYTGALVLAGLGLYIFCERRILKPFRALQQFARHIAAGNLDMPLEIDRFNLFGAFTESFDLMREELHKARENGRAAEQSKKELVASLSHDIKTPVASIKAVTEVLLVTTRDEEVREQLDIINAKAEQIDALITNMFHATLEELQALAVTVTEIPSTALPDFIRNADYKGRVQPFGVPNCLICADSLRLQQVLDNIIGNSYKYAGTDISIQSRIEEPHLIINITDLGAGVPEDELPLIFGKFYRGKGSGTKSGYGLGLFISKYLMEQMSGYISCENHDHGFCVTLYLKLAG